MVTETTAIDLVYRCEIGYILQKDGGLDHVVKPNSGSSQYSGNVFHNLFGLNRCVSLDHLTRSRVQRYLSRAEK